LSFLARNSPLRRRFRLSDIFSWITITASVVIILSEVILAVAQLYHPDFVIQRWQVYLIYLAKNFASLARNIFAAARTPWVGKAFCAITRLPSPLSALTSRLQSTSRPSSSS
jgi:choline transport protein